MTADPDLFGSPAPRPSASQPPKAKPAASRLGLVKKGRVVDGVRIVIYGPNGVGKTTLAADAEDPIFLDIEGSSKNLDVPRYPFSDGDFRPTSFPQVMDALNDLLANEHSFKTVVVDTADRLEQLLWSFILERDSERSNRNKSGRKLENIEDYGYGKGKGIALDEWAKFCARLDDLVSRRKMNVVILSHSMTRTFRSVDSEDWDRYQLAIDEKAGGFLKGWADATGFFYFDERGGKLDPGDKTERARGYSSGRRLLRFARTATIDAKTRLPLPDEVEVSVDHPWAPLAAAIEQAHAAGPADLVRMINAQIARIGDADLGARVAAAVAKSGNDVPRLHRFLNDLRARPIAGEPEASDSGDRNKKED